MYSQPRGLVQSLKMGFEVAGSQGEGLGDRSLTASLGTSGSAEASRAHASTYKHKYSHTRTHIYANTHMNTNKYLHTETHTSAHTHINRKRKNEETED